MSDKMQGGIKAGSTSVSVPVILRKTADNTENTGTLAAGVTAYYWRQGGTPTALTAISDLAVITTAWAAGGWKAADATNQPGTYRLDVDDAAFATGADWVVVSVKVASCYVFYERYSLTTNVVQTGDNFARIGANGAGLTAITGVTLAASQHVIVDSGTVTSVTNQLTAAAIATGVWQDTTAGDFATVGSIGKSIGGAFSSLGSSVYTVAALANAPTGGSAPTTAQIATAVWQDTTPGDFTIVGSIGKSLFTSGNAPGAASGLAIVGSAMTLVASQHVIVDSGTITTLTNLPAIPANWLTAAGIAAAALNGKGDWLLSSGYTAPHNSNIDAIFAKLPANNIADETLVIAATNSILSAVGTPLQTSGYTTPPTTVQIATAVWQDATPGDFTTLSSIGKSLAGSFTALGTSVFTIAALANAPAGGGGGGATPAQIATAVWQDTTPSDFSVNSSIGKHLYTGGGSPGPGATACILQFTQNGVAAVNGQVWLSSDPAGSVVVAGTLFTDVNGEVTFMLTVGTTYYIWFVCPGFNSIRGQVYVAVAG